MSLDLYERAYEAVCQELELGQEPTAEEVQAKLEELMADAVGRIQQ